MLDNSLRLFTALTAYDEAEPKEPQTYPHLELPLQLSRQQGR